MIHRIPDWSSTTEAQRQTAAADSRRRIETCGRKLNAVATMVPEALPRSGPLSGMPYAAKDMIATGCHPGSWGCASSPAPATARAPILERLDAAGARLIASTEMTELAYEPFGYNVHRGRVLNPWNFDRITGGSSSGSAALVASGCCPIALGSDSGGSVRIPAHCCGITALKTTSNALPLDGVMPLAPSLDTIGLMSRSAADLALVWPILSQTKPDTSRTRRRLALIDDAISECQPQIARACKTAIAIFESLGIGVSSHTSFPDAADREALLVLQAEAARSHHERANDDRIDPILRKRLGKGLNITDAELSASLDKRTTLQHLFIDSIKDADAVLIPVMPVSTPGIAETDPTSSEFRPSTLYALSRFTRFVNYLGLPALVLPVDEDQETGMPIGMQLIGRPNDEALLIDLALRFQAVTDWHGRVPHAIAAEIAAEKGWVA